MSPSGLLFCVVVGVIGVWLSRRAGKGQGQVAANNAVGSSPARKEMPATRYRLELHYREINKNETRRNVLSTYDYKEARKAAKDYAEHIADHLNMSLTVSWAMYDDHGNAAGKGVVVVHPNEEWG